MNKRVPPLSYHSGESARRQGKSDQHRSNPPQTLSKLGANLAKQIRFQWEFKHPRNWRRYTPVAQTSANRHTTSEREQ